MEIKITTTYITLAQLLKITDMVQSGGEAKLAVKSLLIKVNNELENRRGKKLYVDDVIEIEKQKFVIK
ncbi:MAG: RNA-binding S4 domain-containing protein [Erysipelotrichaceae bacterium]